MPPCSPTRISPIQRVMTPVRPREISNPVLAISKVLFIMAGKIPVSPRQDQPDQTQDKGDDKKGYPDIV